MTDMVTYQVSVDEQTILVSVTADMEVIVWSGSSTVEIPIDQLGEGPLSVNTVIGDFLLIGCGAMGIEEKYLHIPIRRAIIVNMNTGESSPTIDGESIVTRLAVNNDLSVCKVHSDLFPHITLAEIVYINRDEAYVNLQWDNKQFQIYDWDVLITAYYGDLHAKTINEETIHGFRTTITSNNFPTNRDTTIKVVMGYRFKQHGPLNLIEVPDLAVMKQKRKFSDVTKLLKNPFGGNNG